jgi:hypothetical protein
MGRKLMSNHRCTYGHAPTSVRLRALLLGLISIVLILAVPRTASAQPTDRGTFSISPTQGPPGTIIHFSSVTPCVPDVTMLNPTVNVGSDTIGNTPGPICRGHPRKSGWDLGRRREGPQRSATRSIRPEC